MPSWIEIDRVRKSPNEFRSLADRLRKDPLYDRSEFAEEFLKNLTERDYHELTTRQGEVLLELREEAQLHFEIRGMNVETLIQKCFEGRSGLTEENEARIVKLRASRRSYITGRELGWFKGVCKQLHEMEPYM